MTSHQVDSINTVDSQFMTVALQQAKLGEGHVEPNPMVGCVIVQEGKIIATGHHRVFGGDHAEVDALNQLHTHEASHPAQGATAYVTLEPCCHHGKTPPCTGALIAAGVKRVVIAMEDPFGQVNGGGIEQLKQAGIDVQVGVLADESRELNRAYLKRVQDGRPWVTAKWAMTMDGRIATVTRKSQWITGEVARQHVHQLRSRMDGIIVGMGTVQADDPSLTTRLPDGQAPPRIASRIVFCAHRLPSVSSQLVSTAPQTPTLIAASPAIENGALAELVDHGVEVFRCSSGDPAQSVIEVLDQLGQRNFTNVMVEGGGELLGSFFAAGQIDEAHVYLGAKTFGGHLALGPVGGAGVSEVSDAWQFSPQQVDSLGHDVRIIYRRIDSPNPS